MRAKGLLIAMFIPGPGKKRHYPLGVALPCRRLGVRRWWRAERFPLWAGG